MDYDITESMMSSWLRYVKGCQIVETNWHYVVKKEMKEFPIKIKKILNDYSCYIKLEEKRYKLTPQNLLKQLEIDCLGITLNKKEKTIYAVETAFHGNGLGYDDNIKTLASKMIRCYIALYYVRKEIPIADIKLKFIFATPNLSDNKYVDVKKEYKNINNEFNKWKKIFDFELICNNEFKDEIIKKLLNNKKNSIYTNNNDNSAVFLRACKLLDSVDYIDREDKNKNNE